VIKKKYETIIDIEIASIYLYIIIFQGHSNFWIYRFVIISDYMGRGIYILKLLNVHVPCIRTNGDFIIYVMYIIHITYV